MKFGQEFEVNFTFRLRLRFGKKIEAEFDQYFEAEVLRLAFGRILKLNFDQLVI